MTKAIDTNYTLAFDGGGARGCFSIYWLKYFTQLWGIDEAEVYKYFNVIGGTSVGGIIALGLAAGFSIQLLIDFFEQEAPWIFTIRSILDVALGSDNASFASNRPDFAQKVYIFGNNDQWYRSVSTSSNYGSARLKTALTALFGNLTMQDLKTNVVIPSYNLTQEKPVVFSNLNNAELSGRYELLRDVALATSAAPLYLPPIQHSGGLPPVIAPNDLLIDGGIYKNNPAPMAHTWASVLKLRKKNSCVLSISTGIDDPELKEEDNPDDTTPLPPFADAFKSIVTYYNALRESAADDDNLRVRANYAGSNFFYYRATAALDSVTFDTDLDNTDTDFLNYLKTTAQTRINNDIDKVSQFLAHLRG